jgi:hypothetical protein
VELSYKKPEKYKGRLIIRDASYADTGYYFCVNNGTAECNINMKVTDRKYIYVEGQYQHMLMSLLSCDVDEFVTQNL